MLLNLSIALQRRCGTVIVQLYMCGDIKPIEMYMSMLPDFYCNKSQILCVRNMCEVKDTSTADLKAASKVWLT